MKKLIIAGIVVLAIAGGVWTWWAMRKPAAPDVDAADAGTIVSYIGSKGFGDLSDSERAEFMGKLRDLPDDKRREIFLADGADDKTKQTLRDNMMLSRMLKMAEEARDYFKLSAEERLAALDKRIDEMAARRKEMEDRRAAGDTTGGNGPGGPGGPGRGSRNPEQMEKNMQERLEQSTPEDRAYVMQYFRDLRARMQQRGMTAPGGRG